MKFGPVPIGDAVGAVLAHSAQAAARPYADNGRYKIPKGTELTQAHVEDLQQVGAQRVTVARLEPGDVPEDAAASQLAEALVRGRSGLSLSAATTGRVNLRASGAGLVTLDAAAIHAVNRVNPGITVATVPNWHRLEARGLAATIKIIPYAVAASDLAAACEQAIGAIGFCAPQIQTATLIETVIENAGSQGDAPPDKGRKAMQGRLNRLGVDLSDRVIAAHDPDAISQALMDAPGALKLILTGSATSDIGDTAPEGLRRAGGDVRHYGMPVDPGNLLFLGHLGGSPVIGLPGCARSPALNGADWVLERIICGINVTPDDIAAMGVGGLLKEIPTRPLPRARIESD